MKISIPKYTWMSVSFVVSLLAASVPYSLGLIIAGVLGMMAGAQTEVMLERRKAKS